MASPKNSFTYAVDVVPERPIATLRGKINSITANGVEIMYRRPHSTKWASRIVPNDVLVAAVVTSGALDSVSYYDPKATFVSVKGVVEQIGNGLIRVTGEDRNGNKVVLTTKTNMASMLSPKDEEVPEPPDIATKSKKHGGKGGKPPAKPGANPAKPGTSSPKKT